MKTGTLVLAMHDSAGERAVAERAREYLVGKGRRNVHIGFHRGSPDCHDVFLEMNRSGVDTYCILPLTVCEGNQTVWNMPRHLTLPDNSGSWTMIGEHDVATRFSTAMGMDALIGEALGRRLGPVEEDTGIVLVCRGSGLSFPERTMEYYLGYLRYLGWRAEAAYAVKGPRTIVEAVGLLEGCTRLRIVPFYISSESGSLREALGRIGVPFVVEPCIGSYAEYLQVLDSKVPEDW